MRLTLKAVSAELAGAVTLRSLKRVAVASIPSRERLRIGSTGL